MRTWRSRPLSQLRGVSSMVLFHHEELEDHEEMQNLFELIFLRVLRDLRGSRQTQISSFAHAADAAGRQPSAEISGEALRKFAGKQQ